MNATQNLQWFKQPNSYYIWVGVFLLLIGIITGTFYYATLKVEYTWRWFRVPQYFWYQDTIETRSEMDGDVESIDYSGKNAVIRVKGPDKTQSYTVPAQSVRVSDGDIVYTGDVLASFPKGKPGIIIEGLWITLKVSVIATLFGVIIGIFGGLARISSNPTLKWMAVTYVELIRGSPLLVQILIWYFVLGTLINDILIAQGLSRIGPFWYGVAALASFAGAYVTEIVRAGIQSIHRGQMEAARSTGMTYAQAMLHIILPQALRRILPPLAGQFISLIKDSSLLGIIAIRELTKATREVVTTSLQPFELFIICGVLYLVLTFTLSMFVQYLERRMSPT